MPVPAPNLYPEFNIVRLSHVELVVRDLAASRAFYADTLGFQVTYEDSERAVLPRHGGARAPLHRAAPGRGAGPRCWASSSIPSRSRPRLGLLFGARPAGRLGGASASGPHAAHRDPFGVPLEFYCEMDRCRRSTSNTSSIAASAAADRPFQLLLDRCRRLVAFYNELGFRVTEYTEDEETKKLWAAWMHRKGGVHDMAFTNGTRPAAASRRLLGADAAQHHRPARPDVDHRLSRQYRARPGRHGISNAFFLYVRDPDGHRVEIYCSDYLTVDPDLEPIKWDLKDPQRQTLWGAPAPRSWFEEGTLFKGVAPKRPRSRPSRSWRHDNGETRCS
jgi:catechol 2,3-dioxygenase